MCGPREREEKRSPSSTWSTARDRSSLLSVRGAISAKNVAPGMSETGRTRSK